MKTRETPNQWVPPLGARYLAPSGRIWTVRSITRKGNRAVITRDSPEGECGAVVDFTAIIRMIALDAGPTRQPAEHTARQQVQVIPNTAIVDIPTEPADART
jgi:hypothetical protein